MDALDRHPRTLLDEPPASVYGRMLAVAALLAREFSVASVQTARDAWVVAVDETEAGVGTTHLAFAEAFLVLLRQATGVEEP